MKTNILKTTRRLFLGGALALAVTMAGCAINQGEVSSHAGGAAHRFTYSGAGPLKVTTTVGMINDIVKNVGGTHVQTQALMGAGVDPPLYKATPGDLSKFNGADVIFYNGLHLEGKMADILEKMESRKPSVAVVGELPKGELLKFEASPEFPDPHVWFDVKNGFRRPVRARRTLSVAAIAGGARSDLRMMQKMLGNLANGGLVQQNNAQFSLTSAGEIRARELVHRHRVYEAYLGEHGLPAAHLHEAADRAEHFISPELEQKIDAETGNPTVDPHGRKIPH